MIPMDLPAMRAAFDRRSAAWTGSCSNPLDLKRDRPVLRYQPEDRDTRPRATSRNPCPLCQVRGDIGCPHQAPFDPPPPLAIRPNRVSERHYFTRGTSGESYARRNVPLPPLSATTGLERRMRLFIAQHGLSPSALAEAVGQSHNPRSGLFAKAREGRLKPATIAKIEEFMSSYGERRCPR